MRQAAFDILLHAPWGGHDFLRGAQVLDVFAGTGAFGLEALSRGAAGASFMENAKPALEVLQANIAACEAEEKSRIIRADALHPPTGVVHQLIFLDPPYGQNFVAAALGALARAGWFAAEAIIVAEIGLGEAFTPPNILAERQHGKAQLVFLRNPKS